MRLIREMWLTVGKSTQFLAGVLLFIMFLLTISEVIGRLIWKPIPGSYELIALIGGLVIGLSATYTQQKDCHIRVDFLVSMLSEPKSRFFTVFTRLMSLAFFALAGCSLIWLGIDLCLKNEVSQTLRIPFYPVALGIGLSFLIQTVQLCLDFLSAVGGNNE